MAFWDAGKSTMAAGVCAASNVRGVAKAVLGGDDIREGLSVSLVFANGDRQENIRRIAHLAHLFCEQNITIIKHAVLQNMNHVLARPMTMCRRQGVSREPTMGYSQQWFGLDLSVLLLHRTGLFMGDHMPFPKLNSELGQHGRAKLCQIDNACRSRKLFVKWVRQATFFCGMKGGNH